MKLEIARGLFLVGALSVTALATAAWQEPAPRVLDAASCGAQPCPVVSSRHVDISKIEADSDNLLLLVYGLSHAMKAEQSSSSVHEKAPPRRGFFVAAGAQ